MLRFSIEAVASLVAVRMLILQPVRLVLIRSYTVVDYYCWLVWCKRKILFWLKIYDRLRPSEQAANRKPKGDAQGTA